MAKFKVGDKVRYVGEEWFDRGEILYVLDYDGSDHMPYFLGKRPGESRYDVGGLWVDESEIELVAQAPKADSNELHALRESISDLERRVAQLESEKVAQTRRTPNNPPRALSANERRKEAIEKAKKFVEETERLAEKMTINDEGNMYFRCLVTIPEYVVNEEKRTVVALIRGKYNRIILVKGIAKCAPTDVFNVHIGKAIALGRAYGLDVSEFEQAPQPDEVVPGMVIAGSRPEGYSYSTDQRFTITGHDGDNLKYAEKPTDWIYPSQVGRIISDSEANY